MSLPPSSSLSTAHSLRYRGSLTSPPCTEGIRFYVARQILFVGVEQMRAILRVSHYSARAEQEVWQHEINA